MTKDEEKKEGKDQLEILLKLDKELIKKFGEGTIRLMSDIENDDLPTISTGSLKLDIFLKKPLKPGICEISGSEGSGKTTLSLEIIASAQSQGMPTFFVNAERGLDESLPAGIEGLDREKMRVIIPESGEQALDIMENIFRTVPRCLVILDSVPALVTEEELAKAAGENTMAILARKLHTFLKKVNGIIDDNQSVLVFLNQLRANVGGYGPKDIVPGGRGIPFWANSRIQLKAPKAKQRKDSKGNVIGQTVEAKIIKNRSAIPYKIAEIELLFGKGIDRSLEILKFGVEVGIIEKGGSWYSYNGENIGQGESKARAFLKANPDTEKTIKEQIMELYS